MKLRNVPPSRSTLVASVCRRTPNTHAHTFYARHVNGNSISSGDGTKQNEWKKKNSHILVNASTQLALAFWFNCSSECVVCVVCGVAQPQVTLDRFEWGTTRKYVSGVSEYSSGFICFLFIAHICVGPSWMREFHTYAPVSRIHYSVRCRVNGGATFFKCFTYNASLLLTFESIFFLFASGFGRTRRRSRQGLVS